jgi:hypothetical protein
MRREVLYLMSILFPVVQLKDRREEDGRWKVEDGSQEERNIKERKESSC